MAVDGITTIVQIAVMLFIIVRLLRMPVDTRRSMPVIFLLFGLISFVVTNVYWIVFDLLITEARMPFAANEFGEAAIFLLFGSALSALFPKGRNVIDKAAVGTILFTAANILLWIVWSGEWLQDILGGLAFGYFLYKAVHGLEEKKAFTAKDWVFLGIGSAGLLCLQFAWTHAEEVTRSRIDLCSHALMTAVSVLFFVKVIRAFREEKDPEVPLVLAYAGFGWSVSCLYMSEGLWYQIAMYAGTVMLLLVLAAVEKGDVGT